MHAASVFTPPPGAVATPCQVAEGPPGAGPTVPLEGFCARVPMSGVRQKRAMLLIRKSVPIVTRAVAEEELFFIGIPRCLGLHWFSSRIEKETDVLARVVKLGNC